MPRLRFPEFVSADEWQEYTLDEIADRITEKVGDRQLTTLSISAGAGFISQAEKFSRDISGKQYKNYILLRKGDFSFNKGNSKKYPQGCIYELNEYDEAAVPNAFISFRFNKNYVSDFYKGYFESNFHGKQLMKFITSGARMDGLLNINPTDFFSIVLPTPKDRAEQQKIADCLSSLDDLIAAEDKKLEALKAHKKGLMQKLFPTEGKAVPEIRFAGYTGNWEQRKYSDLINLVSGQDFEPSDYNELGIGTPYMTGASCIVKGETIVNRWTEKPKCVAYQGDVLLVCKGSGYGTLARLAQKRAHIARQFMALQNLTALDKKFNYYLATSVVENIKKDARGLIVGIARDSVLQQDVMIPSLAEQTAIGTFLCNLDEVIAVQADKIEALRLHKKGLMQGLFPSVEEVDE